jgi:hypothetical protein
MIQYVKIELYNRIRFVWILLIIFEIQSEVYGQVQFDYINDWSNIFLSNINQVSATTSPVYSYFSEQSEKKFLITTRLTFNDFYREHQGNLDRNLSYFQELTTLQTKIEVQDQPILIGLQYGISQKNLNYDISESQSVNLSNGFKEYRFSLSASLFKDYLRIKGGLGKKRLNETGYSPWNIGAIFQPANSISFSYYRYEDFFRWDYNFHYDEVFEHLVANEYTQLDEYQVMLKLMPELIITATMQNNFINKNRHADDSGTILLPTGVHYQRNVNLNLFPGKKLAINLSYYKRNHNLTGYFYDSYQIFGKLTEQKDHSDYYKSEFTYSTGSHRFGLSYGWVAGMISTNGHVESWPFTPTLIDLMGIRYNFKSNLTYALFRIGASYQYCNTDWQFAFKSSYERISPGGGAKTWEPEMLVFGVKNLNVYTMPLNIWDGLYLGLRLSKSFGSLFQLAYEFHQYVPLEFSKSGLPDSNSSDQRIQKSVYGGGKHKVNVMISL